MVPRVIFAALVFCSLASRPGAAGPRRRGPPEGRAATAQAAGPRAPLAPTVAPRSPAP